VGGGAVFYALQPDRATLADANPHLIETYIAVRDAPEAVVATLQLLRHSRREYYAIRAWRPGSHAQRAARFIYLNKTCFNGLYRENIAGDFNVPYGDHGRSLVICDEEQIFHASDALRGVSLIACDFEGAVARARAGDVVYFDPPYITGHTNNGFVEYNAKVFSWAHQQRLAEVARRLASASVHVLVTNANHPSIRALYRGDFTAERLHRWSTIAASSGKRYPTTELLFESN